MFIIYKNTFGANLTVKDVEIILQGKQTGIKTCKGKSGKSYKAKLNFNLNTMKMEQSFINKYDKPKSAPAGANYKKVR